MPLHVALISRIGRFDITQRDVALVVLLLCHVRKVEPRGGCGQSPLRENRIVVLRIIIYDCTCLKHLTFACGGPPGCKKPWTPTKCGHDVLTYIIVIVISTFFT